MLMTEVKADAATAVAAVPPREFLSTLVWIKADGAGTAGTQSLIEILAPAGWATPWHVHETHDEYFYILEGEVTAQVGDARVVLRPGDYAFGPRGVAHGYRVTRIRPGASPDDDRRPRLRRVRARAERTGCRRYPAAPFRARHRTDRGGGRQAWHRDPRPDAGLRRSRGADAAPPVRRRLRLSLVAAGAAFGDQALRGEAQDEEQDQAHQEQAQVRGGGEQVGAARSCPGSCRR